VFAYSMTWIDAFQSASSTSLFVHGAPSADFTLNYNTPSSDAFICACNTTCPRRQTATF